MHAPRLPSATKAEPSVLVKIGPSPMAQRCVSC